MDGRTPNFTAHSRAMSFWEDVLDDMEATAAEYDDAGWDTLLLHPGDVTPLWLEQNDEFGLDVLVPNDEFEELEALLDSGVGFDAFEAYRAATDQLVFLVVVMEDHDHETAVCYPAYYDVRGGEAMLEDALDAGKMHSYIRTLSDDRIRFTHDDPTVFAPPEDAADETSGAGGADGDPGAEEGTE